MLKQSLGTIEVYGLPAAIEAADVACKTADVRLVGYEATDGFGMVAVKVLGRVAAVQAAMAAAQAAASRVSKVFSVSIIPRPSEQLDSVVLTKVTVGLQQAESDEEVAPQSSAGDPGAAPAAPVPAEPEPPAPTASAPGKRVTKSRAKAKTEPEPEPVAEPRPKTAPRRSPGAGTRAKDPQDPQEHA